jgi:hypothetical protein
LKPASTNFDPAAAPPPAGEYGEPPVWMQRLFLGVYVLFCVTLGLTLVWLPWTEFWFESGFLSRWPELQHLLHAGFVRGAVSGLGVIDIWLGIHEVIFYRERRAAAPPNPQFGTVPHDR